MTDNCRDRDAKGRANGGSLPGANNPNAKITETIAREIKYSGGTQRHAAQRFGVSRALVSFIRNGKNWAHL